MSGEPHELADAMVTRAGPRCQLHGLPAAGGAITRRERTVLAVRRTVGYLVAKTRMAMTDPRGFGRACAIKVGVVPPRRSAASLSVTVVTPRLAPGDLVRIRSAAEIRATLGDNLRLEGLGYMPSVMDRFCGETHRVRRRVDLFFDERSWEMRKLKGVVILDGVFCEPGMGTRDPYSGCARTCFLFWKEAWLEKLPDPAGP